MAEDANTTNHFLDTKPLFPTIDFPSANNKQSNSFTSSMNSGGNSKRVHSGPAATGSRSTQSLLYNILVKKPKLARNDNSIQQQPAPPTKQTEVRPVQLNRTPTTIPVNNPRFQYDIGHFVNPVIPLTDQQKYDILCQAWKPDPSYTFPVKSGRRFRYQWFDLFPWLAYSEVFEGAICIYCVLFGSECSQASLTNLFKTPLTT